MIRVLNRSCCFLASVNKCQHNAKDISKNPSIDANAFSATQRTVDDDEQSFRSKTIDDCMDKRMSMSNFWLFFILAFFRWITATRTKESTEHTYYRWCTTIHLISIRISISISISTLIRVSRVSQSEKLRLLSTINRVEHRTILMRKQIPNSITKQIWSPHQL